MALLHVNYFSNVLGMCMNMDVILPQQTKGQIGMEGAVNSTSYPTLYLLHGMSDDHTIWQRRTSIERYVSDMGIAVVMPTVHLGWYTDMVHGRKYWTFISEELPAICRSFFPNLSDKREETFAAGLSMGGYGALKLWPPFPELWTSPHSLTATPTIRSFSIYLAPRRGRQAAMMTCSPWRTSWPGLESHCRKSTCGAGQRTFCTRIIRECGIRCKVSVMI